MRDEQRAALMDTFDDDDYGFHDDNEESKMWIWRF
jgi:hypothetical protein